MGVCVCVGVGVGVGVGVPRKMCNTYAIQQEGSNLPGLQVRVGIGMGAEGEWCLQAHVWI